MVKEQRRETTIDHACEVLGKSRSTVRRLIDEKKIRARKPMGRYIIDLESVEKFKEYLESGGE